MADFFLELFSEEIPARMQQPGAEALARLLGEALAPLAPSGIRTFHGPRRIAYAATVAPGVAASSSSERGPRRTAPEQALAGFLRKHGAARAALREEGDFWVLDRHTPGVDAATLIAAALPGLLRRMPWPKQMRWGGASRFTWVRPLRRITCLLDGAVVPFDLRDGEDDGHGLAAGTLTEGHRFLSAGPIAVAGADDWRAKLRAAHVIVAAEERRALIEAGLAERAASVGAAIVPDAGLLDEVAGLVEYPVVMLGRIDPAHMDLPPEVMQVSMRVNQRYFALRDAAGRAAPYFAFVAGVPGSDGGAAIVAGNERVLRARFADARHFWDLDRKQTLASRLPALDAVTFHAKLGSQGARARRISALAARIADQIGADSALAARAGLLCKADLTSGMVGEFPEVQGIMGGYYARHDGEPAEVADAIARHYQPKGPADPVPEGRVAVCVALADKLDQLLAFFAIGEKPTGSGDPYGLRRAALGVIRIIRESGLRLPLGPLLAADGGGEELPSPFLRNEVLAFILDRLRVQLRTEGARHDVLNAVLGAGEDDDIVRLLARTDAVAALLGGKDGANLLAACKRAANILRIEDKRDGPHTRAVNPGLLEQAEEAALAAALDAIARPVGAALAAEGFAAAMSELARLRPPLDAFFEHVTVNDTERPDLRLNRLALLHRLRAAMDQVADFSRIEG
jgi:glycyl-tRNA synthetase beta chain